jgi:hypothetical protein
MKNGVNGAVRRWDNPLVHQILAQCRGRHIYDGCAKADGVLRSRLPRSGRKDSGADSKNFPLGNGAPGSPPKMGLLARLLAAFLQRSVRGTNVGRGQTKTDHSCLCTNVRRTSISCPLFVISNQRATILMYYARVEQH